MVELHVHGINASSAPWVIVLAAGQGTRFGAEKQFVEAGGQRLVDLAVAAGGASGARVVLVLPPGRAWDGAPVDTVVEGGADRGASVRNGLAAIPDLDGVVVVHQAANPLATPALIRRLLDELDAGAHAVAPGLRPADLVRRAEGDRLGPVVGRDDLVLVQTPAAFRLPVLRAAHASGAAGVEDTALVTAIGVEVRLVPGDPRNVHVASPADLDLVTALLARPER
jgi:2-C-methyl-D-erythritol 4-phosphate cytidylyltransferase